jgi:hypothetical protein
MTRRDTPKSINAISNDAAGVCATFFSFFSFSFYKGAGRARR